MATHSSILSWRIPGTGEPGGLLSMGSHRVGRDWSDLAAAAAGLSEKVWFMELSQGGQKEVPLMWIYAGLWLDAPFWGTKPSSTKGNVLIHFHLTGSLFAWESQGPCGCPPAGSFQNTLTKGQTCPLVVSALLLCQPGLVPPQSASSQQVPLVGPEPQINVEEMKDSCGLITSAQRILHIKEVRFSYYMIY